MYGNPMMTTPIVVMRDEAEGACATGRSGRRRPSRRTGCASPAHAARPSAAAAARATAIVLVPADSRNTPPAPNHASPTSTPASAGATTRIASCAVWLSMTAGPICSGSTSSAMNAIRAGR